MASKIIKTIFQLRRATAADWDAVKPIVPAAGEPCFVLDENILKIGDGTTPFHELEPINGAKVEISADDKSVVLEEGILKLMGFDAAEAGAQPRKTEDGTIEWVIPADVSGFEDLKETVADLETSVASLQEIVGVTEEGTDPLLTRVAALEDTVETLNGDETIDGSVKKIVTDEINTFATKVSADGTVNTIKELIDYVAEHGSEVATMAADITLLQTLVGEDSVKDQITNALATAGHMAENKAMTMFEQKKYEIANTPVGTLVDYREKEIRVMCPADAVWTKQSVGAGGDANSYYMTFKTYAPNNNAVGYIEHLGDQVDAEILTDLKTDAYGRKYQPTWLALAKYDAGADTWTYYGKNSTTSKYVGYDYQIDWYDADGVMIASDKIRINLTNEACHNEIKPFYMADVVNNIKEVSLGGTLLDVVDGKVDIPLGAGLKSSDEIEIEKDGTLTIKAMSWDKLMEGENAIIMDGGGAFNS